MIKWLSVLSMIWALSGFSALQGNALARASDPDSRVVEIHVQVNMPDKTVLPAGTPISLTAGPVHLDELSSAVGTVVFTTSIPATTEWARIGFGQGFPWIKDQTKAAQFRRLVEAVEANFCVPDGAVVHFLPGQTRYDVTLGLELGVKVTGKVVGKNGKAMNVHDEREGRPNTYIDFNRDGSIDILGAPRGRSSLVFVLVADKESSWMVGRILEVCPTPSTSQIDLGTITIQPDSDNCRLGISVTGWPERPKNMLPQARLVTLISQDGRDFLTFSFARPTGQLDAKKGLVRGRARIPHGTWYVFPSSPTDEPRVARAVRLLRAGRSNDLDAASIPKVTMIDGTEIDRTVDFWKVFQQLGGLPSP